MLTDEQITRLLDIANAGCHRGMVAEARGIYDAVLTIREGFVPARIGMAVSHMVVNEFDEAEGLLRAVLDDRPGDADAAVYLGMTLYLAGRRDEAADVFRPLAESEGSAAALAKRMLEQL